MWALVGMERDARENRFANQKRINAGLTVDFIVNIRHKYGFERLHFGKSRNLIIQGLL